jgi:hypothetical protein
MHVDRASPASPHAGRFARRRVGHSRPRHRQYGIADVRNLVAVLGQRGRLTIRNAIGDERKKLARDGRLDRGEPEATVALLRDGRRARRVEDLDSGGATPVPWAEVKQRPARPQ